jgi:basic membrane protein A
MRKALIAIAAVLVAVTTAAANPAIVYSTGGKFDGSFNEQAFRGVEAWHRDSGATVAEFEPQGVSDIMQALRRFARAGRDPIVAIGFLQAQAVAEVAREFRGRRFTLIDANATGPNVQSIVYREHEIAYVVGVLAAMASQTGTIGMVGGMDIPLIRRFGCGFAQGAKSVRSETTVLITMTGNTPAAWSDPARGAELARQQIAQGADVILQAAGGTGLGVLQAAADADVLGIGTDSNQNGLHPGRVLTSMRKRVDVAVQNAFNDWRPGTRSLGIAEGGVDWVLDDNNRPLITPLMQDAAEQATRGIATGSIRVHDAAATGSCPFL